MFVAIIEDRRKDCFFVRPTEKYPLPLMFTLMKTHVDVRQYGSNVYKVKKIEENDLSVDGYYKEVLTHSCVEGLIKETFKKLQ